MPEVFGMSGEMEVGTRIECLSIGGGNEDVDASLPEVADGRPGGAAKAACPAASGRYTGLNFEVFAYDIHDVENSVARIVGAVDAG